MAQEFVTAEEARKRLGMSKEQLDALVAEGELRMYKDGDTNKFRTADIEVLQRRSQTDATVLIPPEKAGDSDQESSETDLDAVEIESDKEDSDQTSIMPLDLPEADVRRGEEEPVLEFELDEPAEAAGAPKEQGPAAEGGPAESTEVLEGLDAIDLEELVEAPEGEAPGGLADVVGQETDQLQEMVSAAEADAVTSAETSGLEPAQVESETISLEPAEASDVEAPGADSATVELEAIEETEPTVPQVPEVGVGFGEPSAVGPTLGLEEVELEGALTRVGLIVTGLVMLFGAVFWFNNYLLGVNNVLTRWLTDLFK